MMGKKKHENYATRVAEFTKSRPLSHPLQRGINVMQLVSL